MNLNWTIDMQYEQQAWVACHVDEQPLNTGTWACKARAICLADVQSVLGCADAPAGEKVMVN